MKTRHYFILAAVCTALFCACGSNKTTNEQPADATSSTSLMKEGPAYDVTKIDANAPVATLTLKAQGNTMSDMAYDLAELRVKAGSTVKLTLINESKDASMQHNFTLIESGSAAKVAAEGVKAGVAADFTPKMKEVLVATHMLAPGGKAEITFPAPEKGEYEFICTYPGHYMRMKGKFIVE